MSDFVPLEIEHGPLLDLSGDAFPTRVAGWRGGRLELEGGATHYGMVVEGSCTLETGAGSWEARGRSRGGWIHYDEPPEQRGTQGAGTVHHVAWASTPEEHEQWREKVVSGGGRPTPVIDRFYFKSIYFREPSGVLFEIATLGPGFAVDEPAEHLGEKLSLPPDFEHLRPQVEANLRPITSPRQRAVS